MSSIITPTGFEISLAFDSLDRMVVTGNLNHHRWAAFGNAHTFSPNYAFQDFGE